MHRQTILDNILEDSFNISSEDTKSNNSKTKENIFSISNYLKQKNINPQDSIAIVMDNSLQMALLYITCLCSRVVVCPIDPKAKIDDIKYCLSLTKPQYIFVDNADVELSEFNNLIIEFKYGSWINCNDDYDKTLVFDNNDIFTITFTSGTTGKPKAIVHKAEVLLESANDFNKVTATNNNSVFLHLMPMFYMAGILNTILCPALAGSTLVVTSAFGALSPFTFWQTWLDNNITHTWLSPTMISAIIALDRDDEIKNKIREGADNYSIFSGTAHLPLEVKKVFKDKYDIDLIESYGLSEVLYVSVKNKKDSNSNSSVGKILPGVKVIVDDAGELGYDSNYMMLGYLQEDGTIDAGENDLFMSGDLGEMIDGELYITGRKNDIIIKGGINIGAYELEQAIEALPGIKQVAIKGYPDDFYGENIACFYVGDIEEDKLKEYCIGLLETNKVPEHFIKQSQLPVGPTGKVKKHKLSFTA